MRMWQRTPRLVISKWLELANSAVIKVEATKGTLSEVDVNELVKLNPANSVEIVTAANTITASESGKTFFLAAAGGLASTLPAPAAGLTYTFVVSTAPTSVGYTIVTNGSANIMKGGISEGDPTAAAASPSDDNADVITLVANTALAGDWVTVISDGTSWFFRGHTRADGGITTGTT